MERITEQAPRPATGDPARAAGNAFIMFLGRRGADLHRWTAGAETAAHGVRDDRGTAGHGPRLPGDHPGRRDPRHRLLLPGPDRGTNAVPTLLWVVPVLVQITLDPLLIFGFGMGVRGAALGTVGGQAVSAGMALWFFFGQRRRPYRITPADLKPHWPTIAELIGVGHRPSWPASAPPCSSCWSTLACPETPAPSPWPRGRSAPGSRPSSRCRSSASAKACSRSSASMPAADCVRGCCGPAICL